MSYGKSQAIYEYIVALCEHDCTKRIGITTERSYNILKGRGVPEDCLIMIPKQDDKPLEFWYDEAMDFLKIHNIDTIVGIKND